MSISSNAKYGNEASKDFPMLLGILLVPVVHAQVEL